ncbi:hypothetical protein ACOI9Y_37360, partial [Mesorhizobium japonicum]
GLAAPIFKDYKREALDGTPNDDYKLPDGKNLIAIICVFTVMGMTGAAFAAVPLYRMFCQVTGFGGTTMKADVAPDTVLDQTVLV